MWPIGVISTLSGTQCLGRILGHTRSISLCFQVQPVTHIAIVRFSFTNSTYIPQIPLEWCVNFLWFFLYKLDVYSTDSSRKMGTFPDILNFDRLFLDRESVTRVWGEKILSGTSTWTMDKVSAWSPPGITNCNSWARIPRICQKPTRVRGS